MRRYRHLRFPGGLAKAVTFSYDDGPVQDMRLADLFTRHGLKATFNLIGREFRTELGNGMSDEQVCEHILGAGHEVATHGLWHRAPGMLRPIEGIRDSLDCRLELESRFGRIIRGMAYPDTGINHYENEATYESIRQYLKDLDIAYARRAHFEVYDDFALPRDFYCWNPTAHHNCPQLDELMERFVACDPNTESGIRTRAPKLFYVWGHSYEFDLKNNWDRAESMCRTLSGHANIWYATNIEICDYVGAYNLLRYSADGSMIENPTCTDVWLDWDGTAFCVPAGKAVRI